MKRFFPFLATLLLLCVLLHTFPKISVSAQQHLSFASAKYLSLDQSVSTTLPANASEYYYFLSLQSTYPVNQQYQIVLSRAESLSVSVYDDQGSTVNLKKTSTGTSNWTGSINNISDSERFFLVLHNQSKQDITLQLSVKSLHSPAVTASPISGNKVKNTATVKPGKKNSPSFIPKTAATKKPRNTPKYSFRPKTATTKIPQNTSKQTSSSNTSIGQKPQLTPGQTYFPKAAATRKPRNISRQHSTTPTTVTPCPIVTPADKDYHAISRSNSILAKHFFRMTTGYSISAFELLSTHLSESGLTLENVTPETISLQNNIIFARTNGLAVIRIHYNNETTSCTIYVQNTQ
ncbi:MAG: hypothetical protein K2J67_02915 [Lachnospiraceae bacterium]|nr:hypothetical protein [Lachnospiraceae bacterium]